MPPPLNGWIKLHRRLLDSPVWNLPPAQFKVWITILMLANAFDRRWLTHRGDEEELIERGSFVTTQENLARASGTSRKIVRDALQKLERLHSIRAIGRANHSTLIIVENFTAYQPRDDAEGLHEGQPGANGGPTEGHDVRKRERKKEEQGSLGADAPERERRAPRPTAAGKYPTTELLTEYARLYEAKIPGEKSMATGDKYAGIAVTILKKVPLERACKLLNIFFTTDEDPFFARTGYTLEAFLGCIPKLIALDRGVASQPGQESYEKRRRRLLGQED